MSGILIDRKAYLVQEDARMATWNFNSSKKRIKTLRTAMRDISRDHLFWRATFEAMDFAECSASQRHEREIEQSLARLQKLLRLTEEIDESTEEVVTVRVGQTAWETGQLETFSRRCGRFYDETLATAVRTFETLRDNVRLLPEASWLHTASVEIANVSVQMQFYRNGLV